MAAAPHEPPPAAGTRAVPPAYCKHISRLNTRETYANHAKMMHVLACKQQRRAEERKRRRSAYSPETQNQPPGFKQKLTAEVGHLFADAQLAAASCVSKSTQCIAERGAAFTLHSRRTCRQHDSQGAGGTACASIWNMLHWAPLLADPNNHSRCPTPSSYPTAAPSRPTTPDPLSGCVTAQPRGWCQPTANHSSTMPHYVEGVMHKGMHAICRCSPMVCKRNTKIIVWAFSKLLKFIQRNVHNVGSTHGGQVRSPTLNTACGLAPKLA